MASLLARDLPVKDLYARPHVFWDKAEAARDLALATGADERRLLDGFNNAKHPYVLIARQITPDTEAKVMHLGLPGLEFEPSGKRYYPDGRNAAQVVGVTDPDNNGVSGLELGLQNQIRAAAGGKVATSIDMRVQYILAHEVETGAPHLQRPRRRRHRDGCQYRRSAGAWCRCPISIPTSASWRKATPPATSWRRTSMSWARCSRSSASPWRLKTTPCAAWTRFSPSARATSSASTPSTKPSTCRPRLLARDILAQSSNIGTAQIALRSGPTRQREFLTIMGLLKPVQDRICRKPPVRFIPLYPNTIGARPKPPPSALARASRSRRSALSRPPPRWSMAAAASRPPSSNRRPTDLRGEQVIKPETSEQMRDLLRYVVTDGTGQQGRHSRL